MRRSHLWANTGFAVICNNSCTPLGVRAPRLFAVLDGPSECAWQDSYLGFYIHCGSHHGDLSDQLSLLIENHVSSARIPSAASDNSRIQTVAGNRVSSALPKLSGLSKSSVGTVTRLVALNGSLGAAISSNPPSSI